MVRMIKIYEPGDLLKADEIADHFGYSRDHVRNMLDINNKAADPRLIRLKIATDATWRRANKSRAWHVFEYSAVLEWYKSRQRRSTVKAKASRRKNSPSPVL